MTAFWDRPVASFTSDLPVGQHDYVLINGVPAQVNFKPGWEDRPHNIAALWVSDEAAQVMEWVVTIAPDPPEAILHRAFSHNGPREAGEFCPAEAMERFYPGRKHGDRESRDWWDRVSKELRQANMLRGGSGSWYAPSQSGWDAFKPEPRPEIRRLY